MKRLLITTMAMGMLLSTAFAQPNRKVDIEAARIAFITKEVGLTPEEAQVFWPVYNQYQEEMKGVRKEQRELRKGARQNFDTKSDKEIEDWMDREIALRQEEVALQQKYHVKLKEVLPIKKLARLYMAEEKFKKQMLQRLKDRPNHHPRPGAHGNH